MRQGLHVSVLLVLIGLAACFPTAAENTDDAPIIAKLGGAQTASNGEIIMHWAGSGVIARFIGTSVDVQLRNSASHQQSFYAVQIDHTTARITTLTPSGNHYTFNELPPGIHTITVRKLSQPQYGEGRLMAMTTPAGGQFLAPPRPATRRLEFLGDGFVSGQGFDDSGSIDASNGDGDDNAAADNVMLAYGGQTAKTMRADFRVVNNDITQWTAAGDGWQPHAVIIQIDPHSDVASIDALRQRVRAAYPAAQMVCVLDPRLSGDGLQAARNSLQSVAMLNACALRVEFALTGSRRLDSFAHYTMAQQLAGVLQGLLGWHDQVSMR